MAKRAAELGHDGAMYQLGRWHEEGIFGVRKDVRQAKTWRRKAADSGTATAVARLNQLEKE